MSCTCVAKEELRKLSRLADNFLAFLPHTHMQSDQIPAERIASEIPACTVRSVVGACTLPHITPQETIVRDGAKAGYEPEVEPTEIIKAPCK